MIYTHNIDPVLITISQMSLYWYGAMYAISFLIIDFLMRKNIPNINNQNITNVQTDKILFTCFIFLLLGGRLGYVIFYNLQYYVNDPIKILYVWQGGMSFHGAFIGMIIAIVRLKDQINKSFLELTDLIVEECRRIVKLLEQVEQFGNLRKPNLEEVNLHDIIDRARRSAELGYAAHMRFIADYDPSLPLICADVDQLLQVLLNLIKNAAEAASSDGGTITIRTFYEHSFKMRWSDGAGQNLPLQVEICDDGPGLPEDIKSDIFDPFVSGKENGTGLGLALASKIINDHKGWLSVVSDPKETIFRISLPCASEGPYNKD